jgi:hypothetical protein
VLVFLVWAFHLSGFSCTCTCRPLDDRAIRDAALCFMLALMKASGNNEKPYNTIAIPTQT